MDFDTVMEILSTWNVTLDAFASRFNNILPRYFSSALEEESLGKDFFQQGLSRDELYFVHPHPRKLWPALLHLLEFQARALVIFHLWESLATSQFLVRRGHFPKCVRSWKLLTPTFYAETKSSMWKGKKKFRTCALEMDFEGLLTKDVAFQTCFDSQRCFARGCRLCVRF